MTVTGTLTPKGVAGPVPTPTVSGAISIASLGANSATTDIHQLLTDAAALSNHIIIPYRAQAWPLLSTFIADSITLEFEKNAYISLDMATTGGLELTNCDLVNANFTSIYTGPASALDYANYGFPAREILLHTGCRVRGTFYKAYGATGIHCDGNNIRIEQARLYRIRQRTGWGAAIHLDSSNVYDVRIGPVKVEECDRGIEIEGGAHDVTLYGGGYMKNVYPNGYTGQPADAVNADASAYATYTFVLDGHSHTGEGAVSNLAYQGEWFVEGCGAGVTFIRSTGSNDSDLPRNCYVDTLHLKGRTFTGGAESVMIEGYNCGVRNLHMEVGSGVSSNGRYRVELQNGYGAYVNKLLAESFSLPMLEIKSTMSAAIIGDVIAKDGRADGSGYLVDVAGPHAQINSLYADSVGSTTTYVRLQATATNTHIKSMYYVKKAGDSWTSPYTDLSTDSIIG